MNRVLRIFYRAVVICFVLVFLSEFPVYAAAELPAKTASPDFVPVSEDLSPLRTMISVSVRGAPLRDVLYVIAESTGLNVIMEKGVNPELPVTTNLRNITAGEALNTIFDSVDYFYSIKENMLVVKAMDTKVFEFGRPSVIQDYNIDVGGDIIGGASTGSTSSSSTTSLKGAIYQKIQTDKDAFKIWESIEKSIGSLLGASTGPGHGAAQFNINRITGSVVVTATKKDLQRVGDYLAGLMKVLNRQVMIEARIVEVNLSEGLKYGIDWSALDMGKLGQIDAGTTNFSSVVSEGLSNFQIGVTKWNFTGLLQALQSQGDVKVLSNPRVNIMNGQTALLSVGRNYSYISRVETTNSVATSGTTTIPTYTTQISSALSGIMLGLVPYINENGDVTMTVTPIVSDLIKLDPKSFGTGTNTIQISLPTIDIRELSTTVKVRNGEMVIIGGLIKTKDGLQDNQVPFLGNIPFIGSLFKSRDKSTERNELLIMLKTTIVTQ